MKKHHDILKRSRRKQHRRRAWRFGLIILILVLILAGLVGLTHLNRFLIQNITVEGNELVSEDEIVTTASKPLLGNYWYVFPKRNIFLYPRQEIVTALIAKFPQFASAEMTTEGATSAVIKVRERHSIFVWCTSTDCYLVDQSGLLFAPAPDFSGRLFFVVRGELSGEPLGQRPLTVGQFNNFNKLRTELAKLLDGIYGATVGQDGDFTLWTDFAVYLNLKQDPAIVFSNAKSALADKDLLAAVLERPSSIEYLDLRFLPKIFYKFKL
ncbi:MAG: hypothetical protein HYT48_02110 [Candidatus Vogelbacteria bacterium]|nr:hypothetical protein [Candidatus Vogelbacteria bacterium]